jgi:hypothetical protein
MPKYEVCLPILHRDHSLETAVIVEGDYFEVDSHDVLYVETSGEDDNSVAAFREWLYIKEVRELDE